MYYTRNYYNYIPHLRAIGEAIRRHKKVANQFIQAVNFI